MIRPALACLLLAGCTEAAAPPVKQPEVAERMAAEAIEQTEALRADLDDQQGEIDELRTRVQQLEMAR